MSAWQWISSSTIPSTASLAARISGVVPSFMRASSSVARLRIRIWENTKIQTHEIWWTHDRSFHGITFTFPCLSPSLDLIGQGRRLATYCRTGICSKVSAFLNAVSTHHIDRVVACGESLGLCKLNKWSTPTPHVYFSWDNFCCEMALY